MSIFYTLRNTSGSLEKQRLLRTANPLQKKVFEYAYNPARTFGVTFNHIDWTSVKDTPSDAMFAVLDLLASRALSGNAARDAVESFAKANGDLIKLICNKDLDCGISFGSLDIVFGKTLVNKFSVQLAKEVPLSKLKYPQLAQIKYDGVRVVAMKENNTVRFFTRNGKEFKCPKIECEILDIPAPLNGPTNFVLDGEFCPDFVSDNTAEDRAKLAGRINSAIKGGVFNGAGVSFAIFDHLSLELFRAQKSWTYHIRRAELEECLYGQKSDSYTHLYMAETYIVNSAEEANELYRKVSADGHEGLILKSADHLYSYKRNANWVKMKATESADLLCTNTIDGEGKYEGMIGALVCQGIVKGKHVTVNVGSGLSDNDRAMNPSEFIGNKVEVLYNCLMQNPKTGTYTLFLPRYVVIRGDL